VNNKRRNLIVSQQDNVLVFKPEEEQGSGEDGKSNGANGVNTM